VHSLRSNRTRAGRRAGLVALLPLGTRDRDDQALRDPLACLDRHRFAGEVVDLDLDFVVRPAVVAIDQADPVATISRFRIGRLLRAMTSSACPAGTSMTSPVGTRTTAPGATVTAPRAVKSNAAASAV